MDCKPGSAVLPFFGVPGGGGRGGGVEGYRVLGLGFF